ncbi:PP2C family protein-serine/threonine phosphatase [Streptomyces sp. NPDC005774]|uniref:PP2C family protein-serine/threonine phosphatase n=1 Tax=Streptomyces sp. NPDC005774 TaxID=3364728 RepID=UPI0036B5D79D
MNTSRGVVVSQVVVFMGISCTGRSTFGALPADALGVPHAENGFHPQAGVTFAHLSGARALVGERTGRLEGFFMPMPMPMPMPGSRSSVLQPLEPDDTGVTVDVPGTREGITACAVDALRGVKRSSAPPRASPLGSPGPVARTERSRSSSGTRMRKGRKETGKQEQRLRWLPAALLVSAFVLDLVLLNNVSTFPLLAAAPVLAAPILSLRGTIATGVAANAVGLALVDLEREPTRADVTAFTSLVVLTVIAAGLNVLLARDRQQLRTSREVAAAVQRAVLPDPPHRVGRLTVASRYEVAHEEAAIGGDLFSIYETPHGIRMLIADVRGKGLEAVRTVNALLGSFREACLHQPDLPSVVRQLEDRMRAGIEEASGAETESFATAVIAEIPSDYSVLRITNRGHEAPLLVHDGKASPLEPATPSLPLGLGALGGDEVPVDRFDLPVGATLVLFTDGIDEARDTDGVFFDPVPVLSQRFPPDPDAVLDAVVDAVSRHTGGALQDDAALFAVTLGPDAETNTAAPPSDTARAPRPGHGT